MAKPTNPFQGITFFLYHMAKSEPGVSMTFLGGIKRLQSPKLAQL